MINHHFTAAAAVPEKNCDAPRDVRRFILHGIYYNVRYAYNVMYRGKRLLDCVLKMQFPLRPRPGKTDLYVLPRRARDFNFAACTLRDVYIFLRIICNIRRAVKSV